MNKKFMYRILGALSSALIIVSVFVPFVKVTGFSQSLWQEFSDGSIYLPILIILFGLIGVIFFALNFKTEFAYATTGGIIFYVIMRTIDVINQNVFNTLSVGYYFMLIGAILTAIITFLSNKESKGNIDNLEMAEAKVPVDNLFQPQMPINNGVINNPIPDMNQQNVQNMSFDNPIPTQDLAGMNVQTQGVSTNVGQQQGMPEIDLPTPIPDVVPIAPIPEVDANINLQPLTNTVVPEFNQGLQNQVNQMPLMDTVIQDQSNMPNMSQIVNPVTPQFTNNQVNPVVQEFMNVNNQTPMNSQNTTNQPLPNFETQTSNNLNGVETDIFGQPINRG